MELYINAILFGIWILYVGPIIHELSHMKVLHYYGYKGRYSDFLYLSSSIKVPIAVTPKPFSKRPMRYENACVALAPVLLFVVFAPIILITLFDNSGINDIYVLMYLWPCLPSGGDIGMLINGFVNTNEINTERQEIAEGF